MNAALRHARFTLKMLLWAALLAGVSSAARAQEGAGPSWGYSGDTGPEHWASEDPAYAACGIGTRQSPINIEHATRKSLPPIEFAYQPIALVVTDTGRSFQVNVAPGSGGITVAGEHYDLVQFHFHRPSEERIRGERQAMVAHLVHKNAKGELAVVAVLIRKGNENTFLKPVFDNFPPSGTPQTSVAGVTLDLGKFLPKQQGYYTFEGSLTTPPCSEHVRWFVLKTPVQASSGQIVQFSSRYPHNARPTQPTNGRTLEQTQN
jgi:carbonic anhydrase